MFEVIIAGSNGQLPIAYPNSNGLDALKVMRALSTQGFRSTAETTALGITERLGLADMEAIYADQLDSALDDVQCLVERITQDIARLRDITIDPMNIVFGDNPAFEIRPASDGNLFNVLNKERGNVSVHYIHEGVKCDVFAQDSLEPIDTVSVQTTELVKLMESKIIT